MATALSEPVRTCVVQEDTSHPAFHGCIDWHSAVHGNYALRVISRLTQDPSHAEVAESVTTAQSLERELESIEDGGISQEVPYGFAWFLILDREARNPQMAPLAVAVSAELRRWLDEHLGGRELLASEYHSASFAVFALHRWYERFSAESAQELRDLAVPLLLQGSREACGEDVRRNDEFFDACANALLALADADLADDNAVDDETLVSLVDTVVARPPLAPRDVATIHAAGLNFSRAWSIYVAAAALNRRDILLMGDRYFSATFDAPELWRENYRSSGHWVAQFGIHALDLRIQAEERLLRSS